MEHRAVDKLDCEEPSRSSLPTHSCSNSFCVTFLETSLHKMSSISSRTDSEKLRVNGEQKQPPLDDKETHPNSAGPPTDAPDGGLAAWLVVFGAWCTSFCSFGWVNSKSFPQIFHMICLANWDCYRCRCLSRVLPIRLPANILC